MIKNDPEKYISRAMKQAFISWDSSTSTGVPELRHLEPGKEDAFYAGWIACKTAEYKLMIGYEQGMNCSLENK